MNISNSEHTMHVCIAVPGDFNPVFLDVYMLGMEEEYDDLYMSLSGVYWLLWCV